LASFPHGPCLHIATNLRARNDDLVTSLTQICSGWILGIPTGLSFVVAAIYTYGHLLSAMLQINFL